jgi:prephenate dehydrogenase
MLFNSVCIVGVGLIGGSFGMALREKRLAKRVVGLARREETCIAALQMGAVDHCTTNLNEAALGADLILLAPPVGQIKPLCEQLAPIANPGAIITDAGSTKAGIVRDCSQIFGQKAFFVGGHPMAGSERTGVEHSKANLFEKAIWVLTPTADTPEVAVNRMVELIEALGAVPLILDAALHDSLLAVTSHLPHVTAAALVHLFMQAQGETDFASQLIAGGWRDSTRVAAGSAEMWRDICLANAPAIVRSTEDMIAQLEEFRDMVRDSDGARLKEWFESAAQVRNKYGYFPRR